MVRDDGQEYYAVFDDEQVIRDACKHTWVKENVVPYLPVAQPVDPESPYWDESHPDYANVKPRKVIAWEVNNFILSVPTPSLWAYFASYDHVVLAQLYGVMVHMPVGIPQRTNDIAQEMERLNVVAPAMPGIEQHNALSDAREVKFRHQWLKNYENSRRK